MVKIIEHKKAGSALATKDIPENTFFIAGASSDTPALYYKAKNNTVGINGTACGFVYGNAVFFHDVKLYPNSEIHLKE